MPLRVHLNVLDFLPQRRPALLLFVNREQDAHNTAQTFSVMISQHSSELQNRGMIGVGFRWCNLICSGDWVW